MRIIKDVFQMKGEEYKDQKRLKMLTNQLPPQRGGAVPDPVWVGSKWLLVFPRGPVTPGTPLHLQFETVIHFVYVVIW